MSVLLRCIQLHEHPRVPNVYTLCAQIGLPVHRATASAHIVERTSEVMLWKLMGKIQYLSDILRKGILL